MKRKGIGEEQEYKTVSQHFPKWMTRRMDYGDGVKYNHPLFSEYHYYATDHFQTRKIKSRIAHKGYTEGKPDTEEVIHISQPYGPIHMHTLKEMIRICEENNIEFDIRPDSDHVPGWTIMIEWRKKE